MRWIQPLIKRVSDWEALDPILRNFNDRIKQLVKGQDDYLRIDGTKDSTGNQTFNADVSIGDDLTVAGDATIGGDTTISGDLTLGGKLKHGDRFKVVPAAAGFHCSSGGVPRNYEITGGFDWWGRFQSAGIGDIMVVPIMVDDTLDSDDILTHVYFRYYGASTATKRFSLIYSSNTNSQVIHQTATSNLSSHQTYVMTLSTPLAMITNRQIFAQMRAGASNDRFAGIGFYYNRS